MMQPNKAPTTSVQTSVQNSCLTMNCAAIYTIFYWDNQ